MSELSLVIGWGRVRPKSERVGHVVFVVVVVGDTRSRGGELTSWREA